MKKSTFILLAVVCGGLALYFAITLYANNHQQPVQSVSEATQPGENTSTPTQTPTLIPTPTPTPTPIPTKAVETSGSPAVFYFPTTPPPDLTATAASITPTATPKPVNTYYDSALGFSLDYPYHWTQVGYREFEGADGYLKISDLPDYHSLSTTHVCEDYAYIHFPGADAYPIPFASGCAIMFPPAYSDKAIGIFRYKSKVHEYNYFLLETTYPYFKDIAVSIVWDENPFVPYPSFSPTPQPLHLEENEFDLDEYFVKEAYFDGIRWDLDSVSLPASGLYDDEYDYRSEHCSRRLVVNEHVFVVKEEGRTVKVEQDGDVIFAINVTITTSPGVWAFCEWNGSWILETSDFIVQDGRILNHELGYDEMFGWNVLAGKPFYFFTQNGVVQISYDGQVLPVQYDYVPHYGCCETGSARNPVCRNNGIRFLGAREGIWYMVEIGKK
jgi:hypothetical protein